MTPSQLLLAAAEKIEKPGAWTRSALARNTKGREVAPTDPAAVCWCQFGALQSLVPVRSDEYVKAARRLNGVWWHDSPGRTQAEVVSALRQAAKIAEETGG